MNPSLPGLPLSLGLERLAQLLNEVHQPSVIDPDLIRERDRLGMSDEPLELLNHIFCSHTGCIGRTAQVHEWPGPRFSSKAHVHSELPFAAYRRGG